MLFVVSACGFELDKSLACLELFVNPCGLADQGRERLAQWAQASGLP